jgi:hypothetical protein
MSQKSTITLTIEVDLTEVSHATIEYLRERWYEVNPCPAYVALDAVKIALQDHIEAMLEEWEEHLYRGLGDAVEKQVDKLKEAQPAPPVFQAHVRAGTPVEV